MLIQRTFRIVKNMIVKRKKQKHASPSELLKVFFKSKTVIYTQNLDHGSWL